MFASSLHTTVSLFPDREVHLALLSYPPENQLIHLFPVQWTFVFSLSFDSFEISYYVLIY